MAVTVREIASWIDGIVEGNGDCLISGARPLSEAQPGDLVFLENEKYLNDFKESPAVAAVAAPHLTGVGKPLIRIEDPLLAFAKIVQKLNPKPDRTLLGIHPTAQIDPTAEIAPDVAIGAFVCIGPGVKIGPGCKIYPGSIIGADCEIAADVTIFPQVILYDGCKIGERVRIHAHVVLGCDGFGYRTVKGQHIKVPQQGSVEIQEDVEIGAGTTIDRGTFGRTIIGRGTKIDNLVMIGHNCSLGRHNLIVSQVGIAGSSSTGDYVVMAGQVGIADHCHIGDRAILGAKAGIHKDVPAGARMLGSPATPDKEQMRIMMSLEKLPEIRRDLRNIKKKIGLADNE
ncbi:UDP-3-O-(3-hydroxymyristoyl)glucosamine N-acyltransferase [Telmatocola sphagniphila]|uniref:UDP-3-O-acylglucosamine N-acyltransferase n=1 Tax=Telmatocola sphagniphila TaxID=1123043 RepID=A0A8E6B7D7_9BACT|nr:UDP-3-O-(3-hydroxymyristoyl)glucosamine N-acyltransferase [Telmatocola sphagniphila]QVL33106.1 UDP-3-O-(3-hydroxymyristoyl)glucosamine N-acyltransferase [Telmatocola sphagniphila]